MGQLGRRLRQTQVRNQPAVDAEQQSPSQLHRRVTQSQPGKKLGGSWCSNHQPLQLPRPMKSPGNAHWRW